MKRRVSVPVEFQEEFGLNVPLVPYNWLQPSIERRALPERVAWWLGAMRQAVVNVGVVCPLCGRVLVDGERCCK